MKHPDIFDPIGQSGPLIGVPPLRLRAIAGLGGFIRDEVLVVLISEGERLGKMVDIEDIDYVAIPPWLYAALELVQKRAPVIMGQPFKAVEGPDVITVHFKEKL